MNYITKTVVAAGTMQDENFETSVMQMFDKVGKEFQSEQNVPKG